MKRISFYQILVYIAYSFFILLGLSWFLISLFSAGGGFNYTAFFIVAVFSVQAYYRHHLTDLILGLLSLIFSVFMLMEVLATFDMLAKNAVFDFTAKVLLALSLLSIVMSVILAFAYVKLGIKD
jgi:hypothetical protein